MDKKLKVILVGLGSFGKKYFKELHKNKKYINNLKSAYIYKKSSINLLKLFSSKLL